MGITYRDMISQDEADALNAQVKALLAAGNGHLYADDAMRQIGTAYGYVFVESSDDGHVELWRNPAGKYTTVWFETEFGQAMTIVTATDYDSDAVGFDTQLLMWAE